MSRHAARSLNGDQDSELIGLISPGRQSSVNVYEDPESGLLPRNSGGGGGGAPNPPPINGDQGSKTDVDWHSELAKLQKKAPKEADMIKSLELTPREERLTARAVLLFKKLRKDGIRILNQWTLVYCVATICTVLTPILIGLTHDEGFSKDEQNGLKWTSIAFSILAIVLQTVENVYSGRERGRAMIEGGNQIWFLYESFTGLVPDPPADPKEKKDGAAELRRPAAAAPTEYVQKLHSGAEFDRFYAKFVQVEESARKARYAGFGVDA